MVLLVNGIAKVVHRWCVSGTSRASLNAGTDHGAGLIESREAGRYTDTKEPSR